MDDEADQRYIQEWYLDLLLAHGSRNSLIDPIEQKLKVETAPGRLRELHFFLAGQYKYVGRYEDAESIYRLLHQQDPDDPFPLTFLAETYLNYKEDPQTALAIIEDAIKIAMRTGKFRRHALGVKARAALELDAYDLVEDVLRTILSLKFVRGNFDCGVERDFFDRLHPGVIDEKVARDFDLLASRRGSAPKE
jgi:tetratricopeptide (TPR) repeat protein